MYLIVYNQCDRTRSPERQLEIDECLRRNLSHPGISRVVLYCESDAPPVPQGTVPVVVLESNERITTAEWFRWVQRQGSAIGLLLNADIDLDEGLEHLDDSFITPEAFLVLTPISNQPKKHSIWSESIMKPTSCESLIVRPKVSALLAEGAC
jgi:hypothetical protein